VLLFEATKSSLEKTIRTSHSGAVRSVVFADEGNVLYIGGNDRRVVEWSVAEHAERRSWLAEDGPVSALALAHAGDVIATASNTITLWDRASLAKLAQFTGHASLTRLLVFAPGDQSGDFGGARSLRLALADDQGAGQRAGAPLRQRRAASHARRAARRRRGRQFSLWRRRRQRRRSFLERLCRQQPTATAQAQRSQTMTACSRVASSPAAPLLHARLRVDSDTDTHFGGGARLRGATQAAVGADARRRTAARSCSSAVSLDAPADLVGSATQRPPTAGLSRRGRRCSAPSRFRCERRRSGARRRRHDIELLQQLARDEENRRERAGQPSRRSPSAWRRQSAGDQRKRGDKTRDRKTR
jgi:hypothetical protein